MPGGSNHLLRLHGWSPRVPTYQDQPHELLEWVIQKTLLNEEKDQVLLGQTRPVGFGHSVLPPFRSRPLVIFLAGCVSHACLLRLFHIHSPFGGPKTTPLELANMSFQFPGFADGTCCLRASNDGPDRLEVLKAGDTATRNSPNRSNMSTLQSGQTQTRSRTKTRRSSTTQFGWLIEPPLTPLFSI